MKFIRLPALAVLAGLAGVVAAAGPAEFRLEIRDHRFEPAELVVPAGQKVRLVIANRDKTPEEFESHELNREKIVPGGGEVAIYVGPLEPGSYKFFGEFNPKTATGTLVAR